MTEPTTKGEVEATRLRAAEKRPQGGDVFTREIHDSIERIVKQKIKWNLKKYPFLYSAVDAIEDAVSIGVTSVWQSLEEHGIDWWSLPRTERSNLATPAVSHLQAVARSRRTSRSDAAKRGEFMNRYLYDKGETFYEGDPFSQSWFDGADFATQSAEDAYFTKDREVVDFTEEVANELFGTPGESWTPRQLQVMEMLAYHRGSTVDMGRTLFADHEGRSTPENMFTSTVQNIQRKVARHRARQEASA